MQPVSGNVRQRTIVKHDNRVGVLRQPSHGENTVVGMDDDIAGVGRVRKDRVGLDNLLGEAVVEFLKEERAETGASTTSNGVKHHEALQESASGLSTATR